MEGETLHHCVGRMGYIKRVGKRETDIFFIRNSKTPDVPYFTLEWRDGVRQCYGYADRARQTGDDVDLFLYSFSKKMEELEKKKEAFRKEYERKVV